jgi:hypothetical protein
MLQRKYIIKIAKTIRDCGLTKEQRSRIATHMGQWIFDDNPAVNIRAFKIMANSDPNYVQNNNIS